MRASTARIAAAVAVILSAPALAQDRSSCVAGKDYYQAIKTCSEYIRSHPKDAVAYHLRGDVLAKNGDLGQAIADYTKAIKLDPTYAPAYHARAGAFVTKGDYTRAVADVTKAGEIVPKATKEVAIKPAMRPKSKMAVRVPTKAEEKKAPTTEPRWVDGRPTWQ